MCLKLQYKYVLLLVTREWIKIWFHSHFIKYKIITLDLEVVWLTLPTSQDLQIFNSQKISGPISKIGYWESDLFLTYKLYCSSSVKVLQ